jgi:ParB family chromosome partitioning protein
MSANSSNYDRYLIEKAPRSAAHKILDGQAIFQIEVNKIKSNPYQPRRVFDEQALRELASSIRDFGFLQPLVVTKLERETPSGLEVEYQLIAGERRWLAAQILGLERVPVIIRTVDLDRDRLELAIIENLQRENLSPVEMARAYARLQDEFHLTQREIAAQLGKSREAVANTIRLLDLPQYIQEALSEGKISESHGRLLLGVSDPATQKRFFEDLLHTRITTRELKERVKATQPKQERIFHDLPPELQALQARLTSELGAPVKIETEEGAKGKISISFYSDEELQNILHRLGGEREGSSQGDGLY